MSKNNISTVISGFTGFLWVMKKVPKVKYPRTYLQMQYTEVNAKGNMTKITAKNENCSVYEVKRKRFQSLDFFSNSNVFQKCGKGKN